MSQNGTAQDRREQHIAGLREIAEFLTAHPEVPAPHYYQAGEMRIFLFGDEARTQLATIARAMGHADKAVKGDDFEVSRQFAGIRLIAQADREKVCERVVVGTREVEVEEQDPEALAAVPKVKRTKVVEDVEWRCTPLLGDATESAYTVPGDAERTAVVEEDAAERAALERELVAELPHRNPEDDDEPRCPTCGEPERLLASGVVGHAGDDAGYPCRMTEAEALADAETLGLLPAAEDAAVTA